MKILEGWKKVIFKNDYMTPSCFDFRFKSFFFRRSGLGSEGSHLWESRWEETELSGQMEKRRSVCFIQNGAR